MATLQAGEKARMYALGKIARGGATRGGYVSAKVFIGIGGSDVGFGGTPGAGHIGTIIESLSITDTLNEAANTCQLRINGMIPAAGAAVAIRIGSKNGRLLFAGFALHIQQRYAAERPANIQADVSAVDYTWLFGFLKVTAVYRAQSASTIAIDLVARWAAANGFTSHAVAPSLPQIDVITFTDEELDQAMTRLAQRIGAYWYVDYLKDVHLFIDEAGNGAPEVLTPTHKSLADVRKTADRTQVLTRVYVEGRGSTILGAVAPGDTKIPIDAIDMFQVAPDVFAKLSPHGSDGGAQHVTYTGVIPGQAGSLVGPGVGPPGAPTVGRAAGAGLGAGVYQYAYTDVTPSGETLPSPLAAIAVGAPIPGPTVAPVVTPTPASIGVDLGTPSYAYTYLTAAGGETLGGPPAAPVATQAPLTPSGGISQIIGLINPGGFPPNQQFGYKATYVGSAGGETTAAPYGGYVHTDANTHSVSVYIGTTPGSTVPAGVTQVRIYRTPDRTNNFNETYFFVGVATPQSGFPGYEFIDTFAALGAPIPTTNAAQVRQQQIHVVTAASPDPVVTGVRIYRTKASGGYWRVADVAGAGGAVTYDDTTPDANLGPAPPGVSTSGDAYRAVAVSGIAPGPSPTNARRLYRTIVGGAQLKLLAAVGDNATTTYADTTADGALGANAPTADTSGLAQVPGQVPAGSPAIVVANVGPFEAGGGWAVIGNGEQVIRYTGKSGTTLTGIPPLGIGAIVAAVAYNSTITAAPMLVGIPATGAWAIAEALTAGDEINLVVQRDNPARQTDLATMITIGPGIREEWVQDRRLGIPEARARGDATLALRPLEDVTIEYTCRDLRTASGKSITVNLPAPTNIAGTFKIQTVTIGKFRPFANQYPTFTVTASSSRFSFEDWLRQMETKV